MFRTDAFGHRITCRPRLMLNGLGGGGSGDEEQETRTPQEQGYDFPDKTKVADMSVEQASEYHRYHSDKHEKRAKRLLAERPKLVADSAELAQLQQKQQEQLPAEEQARQKEIDDARRDGENTGAERYLADAVKASFRAFTGKSVEEVDTAFAHIDPRSFLTDSGDINHEQLGKFAESFATNPTPGGGRPPAADHVQDALNRQRQAAGPGSGKSMREIREETRDSLSRKPKQ